MSEDEKALQSVGRDLTGCDCGECFECGFLAGLRAGKILGLVSSSNVRILSAEHDLGLVTLSWTDGTYRGVVHVNPSGRVDVIQPHWADARFESAYGSPGFTDQRKAELGQEVVAAWRAMGSPEKLG